MSRSNGILLSRVIKRKTDSAIKAWNSTSSKKYVLCWWSCVAT